MLLERNFRCYLGLEGNRVNEGIRDTLWSRMRHCFLIYNNVITLTCDFLNALQNIDYQVCIITANL